MSEVDKLKEEITRLEQLMIDTWNDICEKKKKLISICTHEKLERNIALKDIPGYEQGLYSYICICCKDVVISDGPNPELEKKVNK